MKHSSTIPAVIILAILMVSMLATPVLSQTYKLELSRGVANDGLYALPGDDGHVYVQITNSVAVHGLYFTLAASPDSIVVNDITLLGAVAANFTAYVVQTPGLAKILVLPNDDAQVIAINATAVNIIDLEVSVKANTPGGSTANLVVSNAKLANVTVAALTPVTIVNKQFWFGKKLDVVYNGVVDLFDVLRIIDISLDRSPVATAYERWAADSDDDGLITIVDIGAAMDESVNPTSTSSTPSLAKNSSGSVRIDIGALPANYTGKIDVPVRVNTSAPLQGLQMTLKLDSKNYNVGLPSLTDAASGMTLVSKNVNGQLTFVLCGVEGQTLPIGEATILTIPVTVKKQIAESESFTVVNALAGSNGASSLTAYYGQTIETAALPEKFALHQNSPNPFNMNTMISFDVPNTTLSQVPVKLEIFNTMGQLVKTLVDQNKSAGSYTVHWNGTDNFGHIISTGVYFYRFSSSDIVITKKLAIMK